MNTTVKSFKYLTPFVLYALAMISFSGNGIYCWLPLLYAFFIIPVVELLIKPDPGNMDKVEEELAKNNRSYDVILYMAVIMQYYSVWLFLETISGGNYTSWEFTGKIVSMGILCGTFGINVGHELGHRVNVFEQTLAKALLLTSLYMHFFIEHNKGHHKHVATPYDPSTAKLHQPLYSFWLQTLVGTYMSAWHIAVADAKKKGKVFPALNNEMMLFQTIQLLWLSGIYLLFGSIALMAFVVAAVIGALLLETVNYIEHYGLSRTQTEDAHYERVKPHHSWNSNHVIGRLMLFELSRHSDHHYLASRKYQILRNIEGAPQMPTGYPGMIILSMIPPLWFRIMHKKMQRSQN